MEQTEHYKKVCTILLRLKMRQMRQYKKRRVSPVYYKLQILLILLKCGRQIIRPLISKEDEMRVREIRTADKLWRETEFEWGVRHTANDKKDPWEMRRWWYIVPLVLLIFVFAIYRACFTENPIIPGVIVYNDIVEALANLIIAIVPTVIVPLFITLLSNYTTGKKQRALWFVSNLTMWSIYTLYVGTSFGWFLRLVF